MSNIELRLTYQFFTFCILVLLTLVLIGRFHPLEQLTDYV